MKINVSNLDADTMRRILAFICELDDVKTAHNNNLLLEFHKLCARDGATLEADDVTHLFNQWSFGTNHLTECCDERVREILGLPPAGSTVQ